MVAFAEVALDEAGLAGFLEEGPGGPVLRPSAGLAVGHGCPRGEEGGVSRLGRNGGLIRTPWPTAGRERLWHARCSLVPRRGGHLPERAPRDVESLAGETLCSWIRTAFPLVVPPAGLEPAT